jgi:hypothetical protein
MQSLVSGVVNEIRSTGRNEPAVRWRAVHSGQRSAWLGRRRTLRDGFLLLVPTFHRNRREQNQNCGSSEAKA